MLALGLWVLPGCLIVQTTVSNPIPAMKTIAVIPFFNLSQEPTVDGRRFALAYYSELQKTPGFQVIPLGVAEQAIREFELEMNNAADVLQLAEYLNVDAVVVGAVTDYDQYYPPRIGMQISWYSPCQWEFSPGFPTDPQERKEYLHNDKDARKAAKDKSKSQDECPPDVSVRGQSLDNLPPQEMAIPPTTLSPPEITPLMSYTRIFDGTDSKLVALLRDYVELSGDRRSGGWEAYLHRSEDFIRFSCHRMIVEMLTLHGGEAQHRYVWKLRKER